ncbi:MAG: hypothetical protein ABUL62_08390 [Myxococcales bacterium]
MSSVKIKHLYFEVKPGGGPAGYLHNLRQAIREFGDQGSVRMEVSDEVALPKRKRYEWVRALRRLRTDVLPKLPRFGDTAERTRRTRMPVDWLDTTFSWIGRAQARRLFEADLLVVHSTLLADRLLRLCPEVAARKMILMTHSPTFLAHEVAVAGNPGVPEDELRALPFVEELVRRELRVMQSARAVLWPCEEAQIGYPEWWALFKAGKARNVYAETGTIKPVPKGSPEEMRRSWGVPEDGRIALFIGRPHVHKGFDRFADWADLNRNRSGSRWTFVHAGNSAGANRDLSAMKLAGYITDNGAAYLAADLVLIPNRYSYFDLGALEAISLGAKVALAPSGGHGYLTRTSPNVPAIPEGNAESSWAALEAIADDYASSGRRSAALVAEWEARFALGPFYRNIAALPSQLT